MASIALTPVDPSAADDRLVFRRGAPGGDPNLLSYHTAAVGATLGEMMFNSLEAYFEGDWPGGAATGDVMSADLTTTETIIPATEDIDMSRVPGAVQYTDVLAAPLAVLLLGATSGTITLNWSTGSIARGVRPTAAIDLEVFSHQATLATDPFTFTNGSPLVAVAMTGHGKLAGDWVKFSGVTDGHGTLINGKWFQVASPTANAFNITTAANATSGGAGGGASVVATKMLVVPASGAYLVVEQGASASGKKVTVEVTANGAFSGDVVLKNWPASDANDVNNARFRMLFARMDFPDRPYLWIQHEQV